MADTQKNYKMPGLRQRNEKSTNSGKKVSELMYALTAAAEYFLTIRN